MLSKLKRPSLYINHGVWVLLNGSYYPVKKKINRVVIDYGVDDYRVRELFIPGAGWLKPEQVYMTRAQAVTLTRKKLEQRLHDFDVYENERLATRAALEQLLQGVKRFQRRNAVRSFEQRLMGVKERMEKAVRENKKNVE